MSRPEVSCNDTSDSQNVPRLTRQASYDSTPSPMTPNDITKDTLHSKSINASLPQDPSYFPNPEPKSAPATITAYHSKDLPFLQQDPYADDDIIPFDKNKEIRPSRKGSVRSMMSSSSAQSIKRGFGSIKRVLSRKGSRKPTDKKEKAQTLALPVQRSDTSEFGSPNRAQTYMMGPQFRGPQRVETFQVASMAF